MISYVGALLAKWKFDPVTAFMTIVIVPLGILVLRTTAKHLKSWLSFLIDGAAYWLSRVIIHSLAARLTLRRYCAMLLQGENRYLHVPSRQDVKLSVDDIFVTLQLEHHGGLRETYTHQDLLALNNRLRVMGDPGSGKTSLAKRIFRDQCRIAVATPAKARIPIYLELKTLKIPIALKDTALGDWLFNHIRTSVSSVAVYKMQDCFDNYLRTHGLLILLDGLDEVSKSQYPRVLLSIQGLSEQLAAASQKNVLILTMRTQFYQQIKEDFRDTMGQALFIRPFKPADIFEFLSRWPFKGTRRDLLTQIYKDLTDRPTLRELCTNPLVLSMYVAQYETGAEMALPESRTEFYQRVTEELLIKRRLQQTGKMPAPGKLSEQRERILGRLAYEHLIDPRQPSNSMRWSEAIRIVRTVMKCDTNAAESLFREIAKETGLVSEERPGESLRFIHLTFCEFLAANEAVQGYKDGWNQLMRCHAEFRHGNNPQIQARLLEVIPFAAGLVPRVRRTDVMTELWRLGDHRLVARCFLETKAYEHDCWPLYLAQTRDTLLNTPEQDWNETWLRELHMFNVVVRDQQQCAGYAAPVNGAIDLGEFYKTLVTKQKNSLSALLSAYASQDAAAAFRVAEICGLDLVTQYPEIVIGHCDQGPFCELVLHQATTEVDDDRGQQWAVLLAEAGLRSRLVARILGALEPKEKFKTVIARIPYRRRWCVGQLDSLYTQFLTMALRREGLSSVCVLLPMLRSVSPPGRRPWVLSQAYSLGIPIACGAIGLSVQAVLIDTYPQWFVLRVMVMSGIMIIGYASMFRWLGRRNFYRRLLNLYVMPAASKTLEKGAGVVPSVANRQVLFSFITGLSREERDMLRRFSEARGMDSVAG